jgi:hypothetical protein
VRSDPQAAAAASPSKADAPSALVGAFEKVLEDGPNSTGSDSIRGFSMNDEWYAAINGVPVGPIRLGELRRKASVGAVTEDSLVWQEGMEEWRPARAFPELGELIREATTTGRPSLAPSGDRPSLLSTGPRAAAQVLSRPSPIPPRGSRPSAPPGKSNVIPLNSRAATAEKLVEENTVIMPMSALASKGDDAPAPGAKAERDPFAVTARDAPAAGADAAAMEPVRAASDAPGMARASRASSQIPSVLPQRRRAPAWGPALLAVVAVAVGFGLALVLIKPPPPAPAPAPVIIYSTLAAPSPVPSASADTDHAVAPAPKRAAQTPASAPAAAPSGGGADLSALLGHTGGPALPSVSGGGPSSGAGLSQDQIESVVRQRSGQVKRACWDKAPPDTPTTNVSVRVAVSGQGQVTVATAEGSDPAISKCVETHVRGWTFPATGGRSEFNVPFKFVRQ